MTNYYRAIPQTGPFRVPESVRLAGGWCWVTHAERLSRNKSPEIVPISQVPNDILANMTNPRRKLGLLEMDRPQLMGILNVTPDSFSDGGQHFGPTQGLAHARTMIEDGVSLIDVGGESTRPGSFEVPTEVEIARTAPVVAAIASELKVPISIDTRKAAVAEAALNEGAFLVNDVSGLTFDPYLKDLCVEQKVPVCVMHALGDPETMQANPRYQNVLLDVYDFLEAQVKTLSDRGMPKSQILVDPGIGFGKSISHNLTLLARVSLFHSLGCPVLLGASRKKFIGTIGNAPDVANRAPGSVAVALAGIAQGVHVVRVHDVAETRQALRLWQAVITGEHHGA
ncbi:dihydropteroate synthase [Pseudopelagicola sp. nBUS_20]|uniref:dihydropteroate synthase n=1 Tax=Pseudopelagicola sp. nBUS_20 TaxID=3395317 RepID=UPI003EBA5DDD